MFTLLQRWILRDKVVGDYDAIQFADMTLNQSDTAEFVAFASSALRLVEHTDPRRYRTVQRYIRYIVNTPLLSGATYQQDTQRYSIDFSKFRTLPSDDAYEWYLAAFACAVVHEAMHGRVYALGIPYTNATWDRVERICRREEARFAARLKSERYDLTKVVPAFDSGWWQAYRAIPRWRFLLKIVARIRQS